MKAINRRYFSSKSFVEEFEATIYPKLGNDITLII